MSRREFSRQTKRDAFLRANGSCEVCGAVVSREILPKGHQYEAVVTAPTCTEGGYTTYTCSVCGDSYVDDHTDALGHDFQVTVVEAQEGPKEPQHEEHDVRRGLERPPDERAQRRHHEEPPQGHDADLPPGQGHAEVDGLPQGPRS